jgi:hypothetical protein
MGWGLKSGDSVIVSRSLLRKVDKELSSIPNYEYSEVGDGRGGSI